MTRTRAFYILVVVAISTCVPMSVVAGPPGQFLDELILKVLPDGRDFELVNDFRYLDPNGAMWVVPKGESVNGASIPQPFWSLFGGPWEGKYRRASVIHDYFFGRHAYSSASIHRVFYDAMLSDGVDPVKAKTMYWAVLRFNDEWEPASTLPSCGHLLGEKSFRFGDIKCIVLPTDEPLPPLFRVSMDWNAAAMRAAEQRISRDDPPLEDLERDALAARLAARP